MSEHKVKEAAEAAMVRLDLGCGKNKKAGFLGIDQHPFEGVDGVTDLLSTGKWKFYDKMLGDLMLVSEHEEEDGPNYSIPESSVDEINCSHFLEHVPGPQRFSFMNEAYRVLKPGAKMYIVTPYWGSNRAYGDMTHAWPPVSEMWYFYLNREWRKANAPDNDSEWNLNGYNCDFDWTYGYGMHPDIQPRNAEYQQFALKFYKEAAQDLHGSVTARK